MYTRTAVEYPRQTDTQHSTLSPPRELPASYSAVCRTYCAFRRAPDMTCMFQTWEVGNRPGRYCKIRQWLGLKAERGGRRRSVLSWARRPSGRFVCCRRKRGWRSRRGCDSSRGLLELSALCPAEWLRRELRTKRGRGLGTGGGESYAW